MRHYENTEMTKMNGGKLLRKVSIKNGKGFKSVTKFHRGRKVSSVRRPIHKNHIKLILVGKFVPGLFSDCMARKPSIL